MEDQLEPSTDPASSSGQDALGGASAAQSGGKRRWVGLGVLVAALSMIVLDGTIVGVALPTLIDDLKLDLSDAQWVNGIYSVVFAALLLSAGRLVGTEVRVQVLRLGVADHGSNLTGSRGRGDRPRVYCPVHLVGAASGSGHTICDS